MPIIIADALQSLYTQPQPLSLNIYNIVEKKVKRRETKLVIRLTHCLEKIRYIRTYICIYKYWCLSTLACNAKKIIKMKIAFSKNLINIRTTHKFTKFNCNCHSK